MKSREGHGQALKEKCRFPPVSSDGRHSAANLVDKIACRGSSGPRVSIATGWKTCMVAKPATSAPCDSPPGPTRGRQTPPEAKCRMRRMCEPPQHPTPDIFRLTKGAGLHHQAFYHLS